jgi:AcrR family transcriptional regulator
MASLPRSTLKPRKQPRQARAQATVDAIFEATIQVLLAEGLQRLTTIKVAERSGVSVGTLYQYYPHKQALLFAVLERHLERIGATVRAAAEAVHGTPLATMVPALVEAFVRAKTERVDEARALYVVAGELDTRELVRAVEKRSRATLEAMLATAADARFDDLSMAAFVFHAALVGPTRAMLDGGASPRLLRALPRQLETLCLGYLERVARPRTTAKRAR